VAVVAARFQGDTAASLSDLCLERMKQKLSLPQVEYESKNG